MKSWMIGLSVIIGLQSSVVLAEDQMKKALAKAQFLLRQVTAEKNALHAQNTDLQQQMTSIEESYKSQLEKAARQKEKLQLAIAAWKDRSQELKGRLSDTRSMLNETKGERNSLNEELIKQTENLDICIADNGVLAKVNRELLGEYQEKGALDVISQHEPIFGLGRVELENMVQNYTFQIDDADLSLNSHKINVVGQ